MNSEQFKNHRDEVAKMREDLLTRKGRDYRAGSDDVLANFKNMSQRLGISKYQALAVYMGKHFDSIYKFCKSPDETQSEAILSRILDAMNYLDLLAAMAQEDINGMKEPVNHEA